MFEEAQIGERRAFQRSPSRQSLAYGKAGHDAEAFEVLQTLAEKATLESRFVDAAYYFRIIGRSYLARLHADENEATLQRRVEAALARADAYYAYDPVFRYVVSDDR